VGLVGAALVWQTTLPGVGLSPDSVAYVAGARWALAGEGVRSLEGGPLIHFPPFYPLTLAAAAWVSRTDPLEAARWFNAILFAGLLGLGGLLAARIGRRPAAGVVAAFLLLVSKDTVLLHAMAWSEPLAIAFGMGGLALVAYHLETGRMPALLLAAIGLGLAPLTRYAGVAYAVAGVLGLLLLDTTTAQPRRTGKVVLVALLSAAPLILWWRLAGAQVGLADRTINYHPLTSWDLAKMRGAVLGWITPPNVSPWLSGVSLGLLTLGLGGWALRRPASEARAPGSPLALLLLLFAAVYVAFVVGCRMVVDAAILLDARILAPVQVALVIACAGIAGQWLRDPVSPRSQLTLAAAVLALGAAHATATARWVRTARTDGLVFTKRSVRESALLNRIRAIPMDALIWSNAPDVVYIHTGRCARWLPWRLRPESSRPEPGFASDWQSFLDQPRAYVAWFDAFTWRSYLPTETELSQAPTVAQVASLDDGTLYRIESSAGKPFQGPGGFACPPPPAPRRGEIAASPVFSDCPETRCRLCIR